MSLEESVRFFKKVEELRNYDLEVSKKNLSGSEFKNYRKDMIQRIRVLSDKYTDLDSPEADYLKSLKNHYLNIAEKRKITRDELKILDTPIKNMDFSVRAFNKLLALDLYYLGELVKVSENELLRKNNFGKKSLDEVKNLIGKLDYNLGMNINYVSPDKRN
jgi:DNA-directed RNA polymerase alpha subunit